MIRRIFGGLILVFGLTSVHAQSELSLIREPTVETDCKEVTTVIPTCLFSRKPANTPAEMITNDLSVCGCMKKSNFLFEGTEQTPIPKDEIEREKKRQISNLNSVSGNNSVLQASSSSKSKKDQDISLLVYGGQETRSKLKKKDAPVISNNITQVNTISTENAAWQCVTYQEYSLQRELPSENDFFMLLTNPDFVPEEWNVDSLASKFDSANEKDKNAIRLKMSFLSRNPIFQTIMKASPTEKISAAKILEKQKELYSVLRNLAPEQPSCMQVANKCFQELLSNGKYQKYTDGVSKFLMDFDAIDIASAQAAADYEKELKRITDSGEQAVAGSVPTDPEGYFNYLQTANQQLLKECAGKEVKPECYTKFSGHCSHIAAIDKRVREGIKLKGGEISNILREEESIHATLDPNKNASFKSFNEKICLEPYGNSTGEKLNYFQYQAKFCSGEQKLPECADRKQLLTKFLGEYSQGAVEADKNLRLAFGKIISDKKFQDISEAQVLAANNISESPAELRARFGGSFPSISPKGILVPPSPVQPKIAGGSSNTPTADYSDSSGDTSGTSSYSSPVTKTGQDNKDKPAYSSGSSNFGGAGVSNITGTSAAAAAVTGKSNSTVSNFAGFRNPSSTVTSDEESVAETRSSGSKDKTVVETRDDKDQATLPESGGGGGGFSGNSGSGVSASGGGGSVSSSEGDGGVTRRTYNPSTRKKSGTNLLFKYGLDENNQPEVTLVNPSDKAEVKVSVDSRLLDRIRSNPNSFEMGKEDMDKVMSNPDEEVKLVIGAKDGSEELVVYARKDSTGGLSFALTPSKAAAKAKNEVMRFNVLADVHESIIRDPDVYLNQNPAIIQEIMNQEGKTKKLLLQVVSPGKRALVYEVKKKDEYIYTFKRVGP